MDLRSLLNNAQSSISNTYDNSIDTLIDRMGLERQRSASDSILPAIGIFSAGLAVGAVLGLVFAPKRGEELRSDINEQLNDQIDILKDRIDTLTVKSRKQYEELLSRGGELIETAKSKLPSSEDVELATMKVAHKAEEAALHVEKKSEAVARHFQEASSRGAHAVAEKVSEAAENAADVAKDVKDSVDRTASRLEHKK